MTVIYELEGVGYFTDRAEFEAAVKAHALAHPEISAEYAKRLEAVMADPAIRYSICCGGQSLVTGDGGHYKSSFVVVKTA